MSYRISVDTGGTFTDIMVLDEAAGSLHIGKALTTPGRIFDGMREAIGVVAEELKIPTEKLLGATQILIYGTTLNLFYGPSRSPANSATRKPNFLRVAPRPLNRTR